MVQITCKVIPKPVDDEEETTRAVLCSTGNPDDLSLFLRVVIRIFVEIAVIY